MIWSQSATRHIRVNTRAATTLIPARVRLSAGQITSYAALTPAALLHAATGAIKIALIGMIINAPPKCKYQEQASITLRCE